MAARLSSGGVLAFMEQDLTTDTIYFPKPEFFRDVLTRHLRDLKQTVALGLRPVLREAGLEALPRLPLDHACRLFAA